ncbi:4899_t:CDS:2, partial [Gigaspora rosea]
LPPEIYFLIFDNPRKNLKALYTDKQIRTLEAYDYLGKLQEEFQSDPIRLSKIQFESQKLYINDEFGAEKMKKLVKALCKITGLNFLDLHDGLKIAIA